MDVTETNAEGLKRTYEARASGADIAARVDAKIDEIRPTAQLKGFRKGKAPRNLLKKLYGQGVASDVMREMIDEAVRNHLEAQGHRPARQPDVKLLNENFEPGDDLTIEIAYELMPDMPTIAFKEVALERPSVTITDAMVDERLTALAQRLGDFVEKEGAAENGDQVVIDFIGRVDGEAFEGGAADDFPLELGSGRFIPGFEEQLVGVSAGDARDVAVTFPADYGAEELAGKDAVFGVAVKAVKKAAPAAVDDALAERVGSETLDALKTRMSEQLATEYRGAARELVKRKLLDALADRLDFDAPESMVEPEAKQIAHQLWHEAHPEVEGHDHPEIEATEEHRALALRRVRLGLFLADIGAQNDIKVNDEEIARKVAEQARRYPGQERAFFDFVMKNAEMRQQIAAPIFEDKVVDYILELAAITDAPTDPQGLEAALRAMEEADEASGGAAAAEN